MELLIKSYLILSYLSWRSLNFSTWSLTTTSFFTSRQQQQVLCHLALSHIVASLSLISFIFLGVTYSFCLHWTGLHRCVCFSLFFFGIFRDKLAKIAGSQHFQVLVCVCVRRYLIRRNFRADLFSRTFQKHQNLVQNSAQIFC